MEGEREEEGVVRMCRPSSDGKRMQKKKRGKEEGREGWKVRWKGGKEKGRTTV